MKIECKNGPNEFDCKYPDCICESLTDDEKAEAFSAIAMRTGEGPSELPGAHVKCTVNFKVRDDGSMSVHIDTPSDLPPGTYIATIDVAKDKS